MVSAKDAIAAVHGQFGRHPGFRALHAKGSLFTGTFTAAPPAAQLSRAPFLNGSPTPALVRFSNGAGTPRANDTRPGVHGLAVKFTLPDGSTTDISAQTARIFLTKTPDGFVDFLRAAGAGKLAPIKLAAFFAKHTEAIRATAINVPTIRIPQSYATAKWHALHAFKWIASDQSSRWVRYEWVPEAGEHLLMPWEAKGRSRNFLLDELPDRLPIRYQLRVQIAETGDSLTDPSSPWSSSEFIEVGALDITDVNTEREHGDDIVVFDPTRICDGIECSDDPILHFRSAAYSESVRLRTGVSRG